MFRVVLGIVIGFFLPFLVALSNVMVDQFGHATAYETIFGWMLGGAAVGGLLLWTYRGVNRSHE